MEFCITRSLLIAAALVVPIATPCLAQQRPAAAASGDARAADRAAIQAALESFVKAFDTRDAKALAAHWTSEGEYRRGTEQPIQGRAALEQAFGAFFAKTPEVSAQVEAKSPLRFLSRDSAESSGVVTVHRGSVEAATRAGFAALLIREDAQWRIARLSETAIDQDAVEDLAWLIGEWKSIAGSDAEIRTRYSWTPSKRFIQVEFTRHEKELSLTGQQVIGVDPADGRLHTWTFEANGGVGEAQWTRDGDHWSLAAVGTLVDGRELVETNILRRVNGDTVTWQSVERSLDGVPLADLPPVKVTRVKNEK